MKAIKLYKQLEKDFITFGMSDVWMQYMDSIADFLCDNFRERSMGLVCDFTMVIKKVYTAVFPSKDVMQKILNDGIQESMLFVHHSSIWDIRKSPEVFQQMERGLLQQFRDNKISIYNLHVPLDNYGEYSTSVSLARALGIKPEKAFAPYFGTLAGVFGKTKYVTVQQLKGKFQEAVRHGVSLYNYGNIEISKGIVAVVAGGGLEETIEEIAQNNVNVLITGITAVSDYSRQAHRFAEEHKINILGGTHYSTEKFACVAMIDYFKKMGLPSEFIEDKPVMEDM
ncbi:MAG: Nif3-like dinuclear metal center hexameric protein [Actinomycetota bacterium]|nr:Nif3-like dinuclear metal center hexameric protein [Actinomycetota bacterium]